MATIRDICTDALFEIGVLAEGESMSADVGDFTRRKLERMLNRWNAERRAVYATIFPTFTLTPSLSPHTIGPTGATFTATQRPVSIECISVELSSSPSSVWYELDQHDREWWDGLVTPDIETSWPTDFYYDATWPNGSIYFWPVPSGAYTVAVTSRVLIDDTLGLTDTFTMPPGYQDAVTLSLAEECVRAFGAPPSRLTDLQRDARTARATVFSNNSEIPRLCTADAGMQGPRPSGQRSSFNYWNGQG